MKSFVAIIFLFITGFTGAWAKPLVLKESHPTNYTIQKGDTLWEIAEKFLHEPWRWKELWQANPQVADPNRLYPGDQLLILWDDAGRPYLQHAEGNIVKLSPKLDSKPLQEAIPALPLSAIKPFLSRAIVLTEQEVENAPTVLSLASDGLAAIPGRFIYVQDYTDSAITHYMVMTPRIIYRDEKTKEVLGYSLDYTGEVELVQPGEVSTFQVVATHREILSGQFLVPKHAVTSEAAIAPQLPSVSVDGKIIDLLSSNVHLTGKNNSVVINKGKRDGTAVGDILGIISSSKNANGVLLPERLIGSLIVFRTFDNVSFGLIMNTDGPVSLGDRVVDVK